MDGIKVKIHKNFIDVEVKKFNYLMTTNPEIRKKLQEIVRQDLVKARNEVSRNIPNVLENGDPMEARRSVRTITYLKKLGGNLNINNMKKGTASFSYRQKERSKMRGGNRRPRASRTIQIQGYEGKARGFILRWVNEGTGERKTHRYGPRGAIEPRRFFTPMANAALHVVSQHIIQEIEKEYEKACKQK